jgi:lipopolysaccharide export system permease protein
MSRLLDKYVVRQIAGVGALIALTLAGVLLMTQSLRFLELIIESGASGFAFLTLSLLALPRFFEVILPLSLATATLFVYAKLRRDGEWMVMQGAGMSPVRLTMPGLKLALFGAVLLFIIMAWLAPMTLARMNSLRDVIKDQYSSLLFREGVFNSVAGGKVTVYVASRAADGDLQGLMLYDARPENPQPITIVARRGQLLATKTGQQVLVYDGQRQVFNPVTQVVERLQFDRYVIDLPEQNPIANRWAEPEERTLFKLLYPAATDVGAVRYARDFLIELHRRFISPFLLPCFFLVVMGAMLFAPYRRTASVLDMVVPGALVVIIQAAYLSTFTVAREHLWGIALMYLAVLLPMMIAGFLIFWRSRQAIGRAS